MTQPSFEQLQHSGYYFDKMADYQHWLLVDAASVDNLYRHSNLIAIETKLRINHVDSSIVRKMDDNGYDLLLIDPEEDCLIRDASMLSRMSEFQHLDEALYQQTLVERIDELWAELDLPDRLGCFRGKPIDGDALWSETCPLMLRHVVADLAHVED